jgi:ABC-type transport system involved in cytochrome bd biosynthesis fused ATPase/permease subunit
MPPGSLDVLIVLGAIALVALIVFFCVLLFRKDEKLRRKHHHHHRKSYREQFQKTASGIKELIRQHRRRRRREHRHINPTLAQTGGLPPIRVEEKPPDKTPPP